MDRCVRARIRRMCAASIKSTSTTKVRACAHSTRFRFIILSRSMGRRDARVHSLGLVHVCLTRDGVCLSRVGACLSLSGWCMSVKATSSLTQVDGLNITHQYHSLELLYVRHRKGSLSHSSSLNITLAGWCMSVTWSRPIDRLTRCFSSWTRISLVDEVLILMDVHTIDR